MAMYRVQPKENKMQLFLSTRFSNHYQEHDLENWLEQNPQILTDGEPLLIVSRQPATPFSGVPDLIGLDEDGNTVVVELKRGRPPRDVLAQALEYAAWLASLSSDEIERLANSYLQTRTLAEAWHEAFAGEVAAVEAETAVTLPANLQTKHPPTHLRGGRRQ
jgi:RecB family endonuclease NucS